MMPPMKMDAGAAQREADRIRTLRQELASPELGGVLRLTDEQHMRFAEWSDTRLRALAAEFDVDTTASQKRASWGMRIASTLGALALCAALVLLFLRYWGYFDTVLQAGIVNAVPLILLGFAEFASLRERSAYFTGLFALLALAGFVLDLAVLGSVFNIVSTERALLAWGAFALLIAYRYRLRLLLACGLLLLGSYVAAAYTAVLGYRWFDCFDRPEHFIVIGAIIFSLGVLRSQARTDFGAIYRGVGAIVGLLAILSLADWGAPSYLPWDRTTIECSYEVLGLVTAAATIWCGVVRNWSGTVNIGTVLFLILLFTRLYRWWWDWMPRYLFFGLIGAMGVLLVVAFRQVRQRMAAEVAA
jgi:uncharacterized membrane protein